MSEKFKNKIKSIDMSSLLPEHLLNKGQENELLNVISNYSKKLNELKIEMT